MSKHRLFQLLVLVGAFALVLPACGGGGQGLRVDSDPLVVQSTSIDPMKSGEPMNHVIPLEGGCGGPYVLQVIEGRMSDGLRLDNDTHAIVGSVLEDGDFEFTVEIKDTGCTPFSATTARFAMNVDVGEIAVVDVLFDGNSILLPPGAEDYNPDFPALAPTVYNDFVTFSLVVAGGTGPYTAVLIDHPDIDDGPLPLGTSVPINSTTISGSPVQVGLQGGPFLFTLQITDKLGGTGRFTSYWLIETPSIIIATTQADIAPGECAVPYFQGFTAVEGVPPFEYEFVAEGPRDGYEVDKNPNPSNPAADVIFNPDGPPDVTPAGALVKIDENIYAGFGDEMNYHETNPGGPPEGLSLDETSGQLFGIPRRRGTFQVHLHVVSTLVPNNFGQHAWRSFILDIADCADNFGQDPGYTLDDTGFAQADPYNRINDIDKGRPYNPDGGPSGLQFKAMGGVANDGEPDAPHISQRDAMSTTEVAGTYEWDMDWGPDGDFGGMDFSSEGVLDIDDQNTLQKNLGRTLFPTAYDVSLPFSERAWEEQGLGVAVGPDQALVTVSDTSFTGGNSTAEDPTGLNDRELSVQMLYAYGSNPSVEPLIDADHLVAAHPMSELPLPAGTTVATLLTDIDITRVSTNPTGWWDDNFNLNPRSARGMQHGDANRSRAYYGARAYKTSTRGYGPFPETSCVDLPKCVSTDVTEDASIGVYKDGAKMYVFDSADHLGIFMIREDMKVYVPFAVHKTDASNTWGSIAFGDVWLYAHSAATAHTAHLTPQMTISPDGRFGALKLMTALGGWTTSYASAYPRYAYTWTGNSAAQSKILLFSLTGEKIGNWGGKTYKVISTGSNGTTSQGQIHFAASMTLTNKHLYLDCGNKGYGDLWSFREHFIYRHEIESTGATAAMLSGLPQATGLPMQVPNGHFFRPGYVSGTSMYEQSYSYYNDGMNVHESSAAPHPFRVNSHGNACAILAGNKVPNDTTTYDPAFHMLDVWVDFLEDHETVPDLYKISTVPRRITHAGGRNYRLTEGPSLGYNYYGLHHWGARQGPTSAFEISDDGRMVAVVVSRKAGSIRHYVGSYASYTNENSYYSRRPVYNWNAREDIILYRAQGGDWATGADEIQVTGSDTPTATNCTFNYSPSATAVPATYFQWRFGALTFTKAGDGLIFYGGAPAGRPDYNVNWPMGSSPVGTYNDYPEYIGVTNQTWGSMYGYKLSTSRVHSLLSYTYGGANLSTTTGYHPGLRIGSTTWTQLWERNLGVIHPLGGFISANREYMYIMTEGALSGSTTYAQKHRLIGVNIKSMSGASTPSGNNEGRAFPVSYGTWPSRRGFGPDRGGSSYPNAYDGTQYPQYGPSTQAGSSPVMAKESGWVFFGGHRQIYGPSKRQTSTLNTYSYLRYGNQAYNTYYTRSGYGPYGGQVYVFDADVGGPVKQLTTMADNNSNSYSTGTVRYVKYIEPSADGKTVAYVYSERGSASYSSPVQHGTERIGLLASIDLNPQTGAWVSHDDVDSDLVDAAGRVCSSVYADPSATKLYFAAGDATNENNKSLYVRSTTAADSAVVLPVTGRYNILHVQN